MPFFLKTANAVPGRAHNKYPEGPLIRLQPHAVTGKGVGLHYLKSL